MTAPVVRVVDASMHDAAAPVHVVVTGLDQASSVLDAIAHAGAQARLDGDRLTVVGKATQLVDAAGRTGGAALAEPLREQLDAAIAAWGGLVEDIRTPAGILPASRRPLVMGIVNVTPDSFSDGGLFDDPDKAVAHGTALVAAGADVLDVGGVSTRPGADPVDVEIESARVLPVIERLAAAGMIVSVDTYSSVVAKRAVAAGAAMVNDVSAGALDPDLIATVAALGVPYVLMHMQGTPATMQDMPSYDDVVAEVFEFLAARLARFAEQGLAEEKVIIDPGLGFGKSQEHNLALLAAVRQLTSLGRPVLIGASRKAFIGKITGADDPADRGPGSIAVAALAVAAGARIVRVHDVAESAQAIAVAHAVAHRV